MTTGRINQVADAWGSGWAESGTRAGARPSLSTPRLHRARTSGALGTRKCQSLPPNEHTARQRHPHILPCAPSSICTHLHSLTLSPRTLRQGGARGAGGERGRGECARTCRHAHTLAHSHTLPHPPAPLDVPSPPRPRRAERGGTRQWQMTAAPCCAPPPRASLSPFFSLMPPPHAPRQADRAPSQAAGLSPFFLFFTTPSHPDTIGRPPSRGRSSSRCK